MSDNDHRELVQKCIKGDAEAWCEFVDKFSGLVYWAIKRKLSRYDTSYFMSDVDEIYQRIFASVWEKKSLMNVSDRSNISPWLVVISSNITIDFLKRRRTEENYIRDSQESKILSENQNDIIFENEDRRLLDEAMKSLNKKEKAYLQLFYAKGKKYKEIADIFNTPISTVSTIIARARSKIKEYIESKK